LEGRERWSMSNMLFSGRTAEEEEEEEEEAGRCCGQEGKVTG